MAPRIVRTPATAPVAAPAAKAPVHRIRTPAIAARELGGDEMKSLRASILKRYGSDMIKRGTDIEQPRRIPSGIFTFDYATLGGIPQSRISMFHGAKHSGKSSAGLRILGNAQSSQPDKQAVAEDIEGTYDDVWAEKQGVDTEAALVVQPESGEQAVDLLIGLIETLDISFILVDSLAALVPLKELESSAEDAHVGQAARMITSMLRKATASLIKERRRGHMVTVLAINQIRSKIGGWAPAGQEALSLPGGKALEHFTSLQCKFKNKETKDKDSDGFETLSVNEHAFTIDKNKCNGGMRTGEYRMVRRDDEDLGLTDGDIDDAGTMLAFAKKLGWYSGGGSKWSLEFGNYSHTMTGGLNVWVKHLYENREIYWALRCHLIAYNAEQQKQRTDYIEYILSGSTL